MENIGNKKRLAKWLCAWVCSLAVLSGSFCLAAGDEPTPGELLKKSMQQMRLASQMQVGSEERAKKNTEAVDTMLEYLDMTIDTTAQGVIKIAQDLRFKMITLMIELNRLEEAAAALQVYIDWPLGEHPRLARSLRATCLFELEKFKECATAVTYALEYNEDPESNAGRKTLTPDDEERYAKYEKKDYELEYDDAAVTALYVTMAEAYYKGEKWNECIEPYTYVSEHTKDPHQKGYVLMQIINAMVYIPDFDRIAEFIPALYRTPARYDILVNLALMDVAAALYDQGEDSRRDRDFRKAEKSYNDALPLYRMILPREELLTYQREKLRELRVEKKMAPVEGMKISDDELALFDIEDEPEAPEEEVDGEEGDSKIPPEVLKLENLIAQVEKLDPYEINIKYRMAQIYEKIGRFWEAVEFLGIVYEKEPESKMGEFAIHQEVKILLQDIGALSAARERGFAYLDKQKKGLTARQIAYLFTGYYHKKDDLGAVKALRPYLDGFVRADDDEIVRTNDTLRAAIVKYDAELYYMQAVADLILYKFNESAVGFQLVVDEFPGSHQEGNSLYWLGMSKLFVTQFTEAYEVFEEYGRKFPKGDWVDEASFQGGVCQFGLEDYAAASNRFNYVIATYPDPDPDPDTGKMPEGYSSTFPEANTMLGDLHGAASKLREAESCYRVAIKHATKPAQATTAVFQLAKIFKAEDNYDDSIRLVEAYLEQWKDEADIAKALFWIGKSKLQKRALVVKKDKVLADRLLTEVVDDYLAAIVEYGSDVQQDGVDMMIEELVNIANGFLDFDAQDVLLTRLKAAGEATKNPVLGLRLRVAIAMINKTETELGRRLLAELPDFENVPPPVLATICKVSIEDKDYSRAKELVDIFEAKFEDSELVRGAYQLRAQGQLAEGDPDGALETVGDAQAFFLEDLTGMAWAQLMKAQALLENGEFELAISNNYMVIGQAAWRGEPVAQATYQLGQIEERIGLKVKGDKKREKHLNQAFAWYQRVYMQYKGYADGYWAAEAYLDSARCLGLLGREKDRLNTFRALLFDSFVNTLPQADVARKELGAEDAAEIAVKIEGGGTTNFVIVAEVPGTNETKTVEGEAPGDEPVATGGDES